MICCAHFGWMILVQFYLSGGKSCDASSRLLSFWRLSACLCNPQAPIHVLLVPKRHIASLNELTAEDDQLVGELARRAAAIAEERGIAAGGYRTVFNTNRDGGQTVFHIHLHLLGGRGMHWPPG